MSKVFLDTNIFIYLIEDRGAWGRKAEALLERLTLRRDEVYTSSLTLGEVLVKPISVADFRLADAYERLLTSPGVHVVDFDKVAARSYASIRTDTSIKAPDAVQLAVAAAADCDLFLTNDDRLSKKIVRGIQFIAGLDQSPI